MTTTKRGTANAPDFSAKNVQYCSECKTVFAKIPPLYPCALPANCRPRDVNWSSFGSLTEPCRAAGSRKNFGAGESQQKAVHLQYSASCSCGETQEVDLSTDDAAIARIVTHFTRPETIVNRSLPTEINNGDPTHRHRWRIKRKGPALDYRILMQNAGLCSPEVSDWEILTEDLRDN